MSVTLAQLARRLDLSPMTVSRALRGVGRMQPTTRRRVVEAARKLGYRANLSARAIRSGRSGCIALLLSPAEWISMLPQQMIWGIQDVLDEHDRYLALARVTDRRISPEGGGVPKLIGELLADGMLLNYTHRVPPAMERQIAALPTPAVWMNSKRRHNAVYFDDYGAFGEATRRLLELGHRRIVYADYYLREGDDHGERHYSTTDRYAGYAAAMASAGLAPRRVVLPDASVTPPPRRIEYTRSWLTGGPAKQRPTAVLCYTDHTATAVHETAVADGVDVPRELSIISAGYAPVEMFDKRHATLVLPERELGRSAVAMLMDKIDKPGGAPPSRALPVAIDIGETFAPALRPRR